MKAGRFRVLLDYAARTQATFLMPRIVLEELGANYERELRKRCATLNRAREQLNGLGSGILLEPIDVDYAATTTRYITSVRQILRMTDKDVIDYQHHYLAEVLGRAIRRSRPCNDTGEEVRDAVLWLSVLDAASARRDRVIFVSRNTKQFCDDKQNLHPDLLSEARQRAVEIHYVPSLEEFARQHATPIAFVTKDWIEDQIDGGAILDFASDAVRNAAREFAPVRLGSREEIGAFNILGGALEVHEFFVNVLSTGQHRLEVTWWGHVAVGYEVRVEGERSWEDQWASRYSPHSQAREVDLTVHVVTQALYRGWQTGRLEYGRCLG